jgi:hypothetical protein
MNRFRFYERVMTIFLVAMLTAAVIYELVY